MKLLASADHHWEAGARWAECLRVHEWIAEQVESERPAVFCSAGDVYDAASTPDERAAASAFFQRVANVCPVVIAKGNHDQPRDCEILGRLKSRHPIIVEEAAGVHIVNGIAVCAVAWPNRGMLAAALGGTRDVEALDDAAREALRSILNGIRSQWDEHDGPKVLLGHFMIDGSAVSAGQPLIGAELNVGLADLALAGADIVIAGHIHKPQSWDADGTPVVYPGSPYRTAFGETEEKSILRVGFDHVGAAGTFERVSTPARQMALLEWIWQDGAFVGDFGEPWEAACEHGAEVRLRYRVPSDEREAARAEAQRIRDRLLDGGASIVKLDTQVITTTRARAPELSRARTIPEKLDTLWRVQGREIDDERRARLFAKAHELEEEAHSAA